MQMLHGVNIKYSSSNPWFKFRISKFSVIVTRIFKDIYLIVLKVECRAYKQQVFFCRSKNNLNIGAVILSIVSFGKIN